jgi:hypothetical protein
MLGIVGIIASLTVLALSLLITRIATAALTLTGLSYEAARFQARSAFTGTGFTTSESEKIVNHPARRRIIMILMILRSAGVVSIVIALIISFAGDSAESERLFRLLWLIVGVVILWLLSRSKFIERGLASILRRILSRWTDLDTRDYASLLNLSGDYTIMEVHIQKEDWLAGKKLEECMLIDEGVTVLGISRDDGGYVGAPKPDTKIHHNDTLILYGRSKALHELDQRRAGVDGEKAHQQAIRKQKQHIKQQDSEEQAREFGREVS